MKKFPIKDLFENGSLFIFNRECYNLGVQYNNIEQCNCILEVRLLQAYTPRKCRVLVNGNEYSMYYSENKIKISKDEIASFYDSFYYESVICVENKNDAIEILKNQGYDRIRQ